MISIDTLLAWGATYKKVSRNETIFSEGTEGRFYHQLVSGSVRWGNINEEGKEFIQNIIQPGESFGEFPLFDDSAYAASAIASVDSIIIRLHKVTFLNLLKEYPEIHFAFTRILTQRLRFKFLLLKELAYFGPEHRISTLLSHLKESQKKERTQKFQVQLTRQEIANMTGLRVETVIRSIRHLQDKGALVINKGKVYC
jgi:CRP/FNR family transcriptional regulator, cyclic AMP receptor protein